MSGGEKLLKSVFFQPVFLSVVFSRKREKEQEIGGERASWRLPWECDGLRERNLSRINKSAFKEEVISSIG